MALLGTLVNGFAIIIGTVLGLFFKNIPEKQKETILSGVALVVILIGLDMALQVNHIIIVILSMMMGAVIGEAIDLDRKLNKIGARVERLISNKEMDSRISQGFITASLIFVVGAMGVIGALDGGLRNDHGVLLTKSILDGFTALVLTTTLGIGVIFSAIPVVIYQGSIALLATFIYRWIPATFLDAFIVEMTAIGGLLIVAIGLNMLSITKIRVANLLPSLLIVGMLLSIYQYFF
ncbi:putative membrane protein YqgA involved in biofilm formation [Natronobacillus azotifigens]|uniref:DUF554 domain-containing protein n=1 Tax=Natronobacillus azotifigens TaxID=472978 RepID=A0A9J6R9B0_9BACI|nr:DUF554 domain-containing protein [Natronobacillus azotifigens]MCZ0702224.1 DUF554 domain-containing protein [Natronobacillus azotifigens]